MRSCFLQSRITSSGIPSSFALALTCSRERAVSTEMKRRGASGFSSRFTSGGSSSCGLLSFLFLNLLFLLSPLWNRSLLSGRLSHSSFFSSWAESWTEASSFVSSVPFVSETSTSSFFSSTGEGISASTEGSISSTAVSSALISSALSALSSFLALGFLCRGALFSSLVFLGFLPLFFGAFSSS